jgi:hypothetical protein
MGDVPRSKRARVVVLLEHWEDFWLPPAGGGGSGSGSSPHLGAMARHPSVVELVRCLAVLKREQPRLHDHVKAFYGAEWRVRVRAGTRKRPRGKVERVVLRDRVRVVPGWVAPGYVRAGEARLAELFVGPVFIPEELYDALTLSSAAIEEKRLRRRSRGGEPLAAA